MINWILQKNLTKPEILERIKSSLKNDGESWEEIEIIPFSTNLPPIKNKESFPIIYGSTTFMINAYKNKEYQRGVFYDPIKFQMKNYVNQWGRNVLNSDGISYKLIEILEIDEPDSSEFFIRPNHDLKEFSGRVETLKDLKIWVKQIIKLESPVITKNTEIWLSKPKEIEKEWRIFVVDKEIISISRYLDQGELSESDQDIPKELVKFTEDQINQYEISSVYVIDIAKLQESYKIIECNCFNGTGFYKHNIEEIVRKINEFVRRKMINGA